MALSLFLVTGVLVYLAVFAGLFVLTSFGVYRMASHAGVPHPWLGLVPFGNAYVTGLLAERSVYVYTDKKRSLAFWCPIFQALALVGLMAVVGLALLDADFGFWVVISLLVFFVGFTVYLVLSIYCQYYIFKDYSPDNSTLYIVLSILFHIHWIFLLVEMNTVPVSVTGFGVWPNGRPKYDRYHQWQAGGPASPYPAPPSQGPYTTVWQPVQPFHRDPSQGGYQGQGPGFYRGGQAGGNPQASQGHTPPAEQGYQYIPGEAPGGEAREPRFYQGSGYYRGTDGQQRTREDEGSGGPELK